MSAPVCAEDQVAINGVCVYVFPTSMNWEDAKDSCAENGSQLAFVKEEADWQAFQATR